MKSVKSIVRSILAVRVGGKLAKSFGYTSLFLVLFSFFLILSLPLDRFSSNIEGLLEGALNRKVRIGDISTAITGGVVLNDVEIGVGKSDDDENDIGSDKDKTLDGDDDDDDDGDGGGEKKTSKPVINYLLDKVAIDVGLFSFLFGELDVNADVTGLGGEISVSYTGPMSKGSGDAEKKSKKTKKKKTRTKKSRSSKKSKKSKEKDAAEADDQADSKTDESADEDENDADVPVSVSLKMSEIQLRQVHDIRSALPVPLSGVLDLEMSLASKTSGFGSASGALTFTLKNVTLSKKGYEASIMGSSLIVPELSIDAVEARIEFKDGVGKVAKFKMVSRHVDLGLEGSITLDDDLKRSRVDLYLTFMVKDKYLAESAAIKTVYSSVDTFSRKMASAHRDDGYYGFRYRGLFGKGRFSPAKNYAGSGGDSETRSAKKKSRRNRSRSRSNRRKSSQNEREVTGAREPPSPPPSAAVVAPEPPPGIPNPRAHGIRDEREGIIGEPPPVHSPAIRPPRPIDRDIHPDDDDEDIGVPSRRGGRSGARRHMDDEESIEEGEEVEEEEEEGEEVEEEEEEEEEAAEEEEGEEEAAEEEGEEEEGEEEANEEEAEEEGEKEMIEEGNEGDDDGDEVMTFDFLNRSSGFRPRPMTRP